jgi:hypothetical protein
MTPVAGRTLGRQTSPDPKEPKCLWCGQRLADRTGAVAGATAVGDVERFCDQVIDTAIINVSISSVVQDLESTVCGVQSAIALEALVSKAFILIGSNVGDLVDASARTCSPCSATRSVRPP